MHNDNCFFISIITLVRKQISQLSLIPSNCLWRRCCLVDQPKKEETQNFLVWSLGQNGLAAELKFLALACGHTPDVKSSHFRAQYETFAKLLKLVFLTNTIESASHLQVQISREGKGNPNQRPCVPSPSGGSPEFIHI